MKLRRFHTVTRLALLMAAAGAFGHQKTVAEDDEVEARDDAAVAVAQALLAHDQSIESLEWETAISQRMMLPTGPDGQLEWSEWELIHDGRYGADSKGNWYIDGRFGGRPGVIDGHLVEVDHDLPLTFQDVRYAASVSHTVAWTPGTNDYIIRRPQDFPKWSPGPFMALGRHVDWAAPRRLGEILLDGEELCIQDVDPEAGLVVLRVRTTIDRQPMVIEVTVDTNHGYAPKIIRRFDARYHHLAAEIVTEQFEQIEGIWVPAEETRIVYARAMPSQEKIDEIIRVQARIAGERDLPEVDDGVIAATYAEVFGPAGHPLDSQLMEHRFEAIRFHSINRGLPDEYMIAEIALQSRVFNEITGLNTLADGIEEVIAGCPLIRAREEAGETSGAAAGSQNAPDQTDSNHDRESSQ